MGERKRRRFRKRDHNRRRRRRRDRSRSPNVSRRTRKLTSQSDDASLRPQEISNTADPSRAPPSHEHPRVKSKSPSPPRASGNGRKYKLDGDWTCRKCKFSNYHFNMVCYMCKENRPLPNVIEPDTVSAQRNPMKVLDAWAEELKKKNSSEL